MPSVSRSKQHHAILGHGAIFIGWFLALLVGGMPGGLILSLLPGADRLAEYTFFLPQFMLAFIGAVHRTPTGDIPIFARGTGGLLSVVLWVVVLGLFSWATRNRRLLSAVIAAPITILLVTILVNLLLRASGISIELDGP